MKTRKDAGGLGVGELVYDADIYDGLNTYTGDVPFYLEACRRARGPVLELCCGSGRLTLPLLKAGIDITGLDFTPSMLAAARRKASALGLPDVFLRGDMLKARLGRKFKLVFIPFNSIQNIYTLEDVEKVFRTVRAHLACVFSAIRSGFSFIPVSVLADAGQCLTTSVTPDGFSLSFLRS